MSDVQDATIGREYRFCRADHGYGLEGNIGTASGVERKPDETAAVVQKSAEDPSQAVQKAAIREGT